ncbi:GDSL-type esterase/lipase family protein [uncultured Hymenobacter sp.]|uniref:GDSL-type esterase/lipase family protein n=1 Tax=uncultured Hymenobacter sp. TaxID=170016 RepID=UPI0035CBF18C
MLRSFHLAAVLGAGLLLAACSSAPDTPATATSAAVPTPPQPAVGALAQPAAQTILFFGNSLTAGLGVEPEEAFPALVGQKIDSASLGYKVINAGLSGETTAGGRSRVGWVLGRQPVAIFVLELGGNDGLRGLPLTDTRRNLQAIIDTVRARSPQTRIVLAGMQIPPNLGPQYSADFKQLYAETATKNQLVLIPFLLEGVGGVRALNQPDQIHPTPAGHRLIARTVWRVLRPVLSQPTAQ